MKIVKSGFTKGNDRVAYAKDGNSFSVIIEKTNYSLGRDRKNWCLIKDLLSEKEAIKLFNRRNNKPLAEIR